MVENVVAASDRARYYADTHDDDNKSRRCVLTCIRFVVISRFFCRHLVAAILLRSRRRLLRSSSSAVSCEHANAKTDKSNEHIDARPRPRNQTNVKRFSGGTRVRTERDLPFRNTVMSYRFAEVARTRPLARQFSYLNHE